jgi:hypothetical protein
MADDHGVGIHFSAGIFGSGSHREGKNKPESSICVYAGVNSLHFLEPEAMLVRK